MSEKYKPNPEDEKKMEDLLNQAKGIIRQPAERDPLEMARASREEANERFLDETSDFLTNIERGDNLELYYRTLAEEIPDLALSFDEMATDMEGRPLPNHIVIKAVPYKTDRMFLDDLRDNQIISLFTNPNHTVEYKEMLGYKLEKIALLPKGTTAFFLAKDYRDKIKQFPDMKDIFDKRYGKYKTLEPLSNEEIKKLLRKEIREEYKNKL